MSSHVVTMLAYLAVAALLLISEALARWTSVPIPSFPALVRGALRHRGAQFGLLLAWWWIGWHFFVG